MGAETVKSVVVYLQYRESPSFYLFYFCFFKNLLYTASVGDLSFPPKWHLTSRICEIYNTWVQKRHSSFTHRIWTLFSFLQWCISHTHTRTHTLCIDVWIRRSGWKSHLHELNFETKRRDLQIYHIAWTTFDEINEVFSFSTECLILLLSFIFFFSPLSIPSLGFDLTIIYS